MFENLVITDIRHPATVVFARGATIDMQHRTTYGLSFCERGQITYTMGGKQYVSTPSCVMLLPQGQSYSLHVDKDGTFPLINFTCAQPLTTEIVPIPMQNATECIKDCEKIKSLFLFEENRLKIFSIFYHILHRIDTEQGKKQNEFYHILKFIEEHLADSELSNRVLAQQMNISEVHFRRSFAQKYHMTPKQYIIDIRMQKAKQLLTDSALSITAVSEACGFSGVYNFSRAFKEKVGLSPSEYAKHHKLSAI